MLKPQTAMVFAAGLGKRMRPITDRLPKPMIPVQGKTMLARALDAVAKAGIPHAVVNTHHKADIVQHYIKERRSTGQKPDIDVSFEETLLETGGGIVHAQKKLGKSPIYTINSDIIWEDGNIPALERLAAMWDPEKMDALLLLHPTDKAFGYDGPGNFDIKPNGQLMKSNGDTQPYVYTGVQIINPCLFYDMNEEPFSLNVLYKNALCNDGSLNRIYGLVHDGNWFHIGTPEALETIEKNSLIR